MPPIATDVWHGLSACLRVCDVTTRYPAKTAAPIEMPFGVWDGVGHSNYVIEGGLEPPRGKGNFGVGKGPSIVKYRDNVA